MQHRGDHGGWDGPGRSHNLGRLLWGGGGWGGMCPRTPGTGGQVEGSIVMQQPGSISHEGGRGQCPGQAAPTCAAGTGAHLPRGGVCWVSQPGGGGARGGLAGQAPGGGQQPGHPGDPHSWGRGRTPDCEGAARSPWRHWVAALGCVGE